MRISKLKTFTLAFFSMICFTIQADVISDFKSGDSLDKVIQKALNQGVPVSEIVTPLIIKAGVSPTVVTKAAIKASKNKVAICHKGKNTLSLPRSAIQAHLNHGDTMGACGKNDKSNQNLDSELINIMIAAILSKPEQAPEILTVALENIAEISLDNAVLLTLTAMVLVPEQKREILKAASDKDSKLGDEINFIETTTFKNGFYSTESYTLSNNSGGGCTTNEGDSASECLTITITTTGSQISVSPHR